MHKFFSEKYSAMHSKTLCFFVSVFDGVIAWQTKIWRLVRFWCDVTSGQHTAPAVTDLDQELLQKYVVDVFDARNYFLKEVRLVIGLMLRRHAVSATLTVCLCPILYHMLLYM